MFFTLDRRKKKCIRYLEGEGGDAGVGIGSPDDNLGSAGSVGSAACTPDSKAGMDSDMDCGKSSDMGMSSPNFSLTSPGKPCPIQNIRYSTKNMFSMPEFDALSNGEFVS